MNLQDIAVLESKIRHGSERAVAHDDDVAPREFEEALDIGDIFAAAMALPRQAAAQAELAAKADGDDSADICDFHQTLPHKLSYRERAPGEVRARPGRRVTPYTFRRNARR